MPVFGKLKIPGTYNLLFKFLLSFKYNVHYFITGHTEKTKKHSSRNESNDDIRTIVERRWTIIALRNLIFYFWSNIELTWHECSFMPQIINYKEKMLRKKNVEPILGLFKVGLILSIWLYSKQQKLPNQNLVLKYF